MNLAYNVAQVMHRIRVKLYPNYLPGNLFHISGNKIKIEGDDPSVGLFLVPPGGEAVKITRLNENSHTSIRGITPNCNFDNCRLEIRTQYTGSKPLKSPRVITSHFTLDRA